MCRAESMIALFKCEFLLLFTFKCNAIPNVFIYAIIHSRKSNFEDEVFYIRLYKTSDSKCTLRSTVLIKWYDT